MKFTLFDDKGRPDSIFLLLDKAVPDDTQNSAKNKGKQGIITTININD